MRVVEMPGRQGDGGQRGSGVQRIELGREEKRREQEDHGNDHTESRKLVNLGKRYLHDTPSVVCKMLKGRKKRCGQHRTIYTPPTNHTPHSHVVGGRYTPP